MMNKWSLNRLWTTSAAHISMNHPSVCSEISSVTLKYWCLFLLPSSTIGDLIHSCTFFTIQEDSNVSPLLLSTPMLARFAWNISKCLLCPWRGCYDQRVIFVQIPFLCSYSDASLVFFQISVNGGIRREFAETRWGFKQQGDHRKV